MKPTTQRLMSGLAKLRTYRHYPTYRANVEARREHADALRETAQKWAGGWDALREYVKGLHGKLPN